MDLLIKASIIHMCVCLYIYILYSFLWFRILLLLSLWLQNMNQFQYSLRSNSWEQENKGVADNRFVFNIIGFYYSSCSPFFFPLFLLGLN